MKRFFKIVGWIALGLAALFVWFAFPEIQPAVGYGVLAAAGYWYVTNVLKQTIVAPVSAEMVELKYKVDQLDKKVSALLEDAYQRRMGHR